MRMRKLASRFSIAGNACSKEKEGLIKECSITTDSLPKLAKIKQDEKLLGVAVQKSVS